LPQIVPFSAGEDPINAGDVVSLTCTIAKGDSPMSIHWLFNSSEIESSDEVTISKLGRKVSTLYIESARAQYMGEYTCVAKNAAGATNFSTSLHVNGLPISHLQFAFVLLKLSSPNPRASFKYCFRIKN
jgi:Immunoglobulin I-set domain